MQSRRSKQKYTLSEIATFDARRGYKRCRIPGVVCQPPVNPILPVRPVKCYADFWWAPPGRLVIRFHSHYGYSFHFEGRRSSGKPLQDPDLEAFASYIEDVLVDWEGTDDPPDPDC